MCYLNGDLPTEDFHLISQCPCRAYTNASTRFATFGILGFFCFTVLSGKFELNLHGSKRVMQALSAKGACVSLLSYLFKKKQPSLNKEDGTTKTSGELISEVTDGANLVDGKQTWELAEENKDDLEIMKRCCDAELKTMDKAGLVPAPYYFERVAILFRKSKDYAQEIFYCEQHIEKVESFYSKNGTKGIADVRKGPRFKAIVKRLPKAKELYAKQST